MKRMHRYEPGLALVAGLLLAFAAPPACSAQEPAPAAGPQAQGQELAANPGPQTPEPAEIAAQQAEEVQVDAIELLDAAALEALVAPVALYPDDLLAIMLPASTYPLQVVQAARFLRARNEGVPGEPSEDWNEAIVALLNYPEALQLLNEDLDWTWRLGEAVQIQEQDVILAISAFREQAHLAGNLESDGKQTVFLGDEGAIEIKPALPDEIYVPYYEPAEVVVRQPAPVYRYYPQPYPVYYYPYHASRQFPYGRFWGVTSAFSLGWRAGRLHRHLYGFHDHPYFGYNYYDPFYYRRPSVFVIHDHDRRRRHERSHKRHHEGNRWRSDDRRQGARPNAKSRQPGRLRGAGRRVEAHGMAPPAAAVTRNRPSIRTGGGPNAPQPPAQTASPAKIGVRAHETGAPKPGAIRYRPAGVASLQRDEVRRPFPTGAAGARSAGRTGRAAVHKAPARIAPSGGLRRNPAPESPAPSARAPKAPVRTATIHPRRPPSAANRASRSTGKAPPASINKAVRRQPVTAKPRQTPAVRPAGRPSMPSSAGSPPGRDAASVQQRTHSFEQPTRARAQPTPRTNSRAQAARQTARARPSADRPPARRTKRAPPPAPRTKPRR